MDFDLLAALEVIGQARAADRLTDDEMKAMATHLAKFSALTKTQAVTDYYIKYGSTKTTINF